MLQNSKLCKKAIYAPALQIWNWKEVKEPARRLNISTYLFIDVDIYWRMRKLQNQILTTGLHDNLTQTPLTPAMNTSIDANLIFSVN